MPSSVADPYLITFNVFAIVSWVALALSTVTRRQHVPIYPLAFVVRFLVLPIILSLVYVAVFVRSEVGPKNGNGGHKGFFQIQNICYNQNLEKLQKIQIIYLTLV